MNMAHGKIKEVGNLTILDCGGEQHEYKCVLLIEFDSAADIKKAIADRKCTFSWGEIDKRTKTDLLLHNLRTIGTHHCDKYVGEEAAQEIECLRSALFDLLDHDFYYIGVEATKEDQRGLWHSVKRARELLRAKT